MGRVRLVGTLVRQCVTGRRISARPQPQLAGQLPKERVSPDHIFEPCGRRLCGATAAEARKHEETYNNQAICLPLRLLDNEGSYRANYRSFPSVSPKICNQKRASIDHHEWQWNKFAGAKNVLKELYSFLNQSCHQQVIIDSCSTQGICWKFIPERSPHFGGLWEASVRSVKTYLWKIIGNVKLTYEEFSTVLAQVKSCLNSTPLLPMMSSSGEEVEPWRKDISC